MKTTRVPASIQLLFYEIVLQPIDENLNSQTASSASRLEYAQARTSSAATCAAAIDRLLAFPKGARSTCSVQMLTTLRTAKDAESSQCIIAYDITGPTIITSFGPKAPIIGFQLRRALPEVMCIARYKPYRQREPRLLLVPEEALRGRARPKGFRILSLSVANRSDR